MAEVDVLLHSEPLLHGEAPGGGAGIPPPVVFGAALPAKTFGKEGNSEKGVDLAVHQLAEERRIGVGALPGRRYATVGVELVEGAPRHPAT
jgi:hypothetical protein